MAKDFWSKTWAWGLMVVLLAFAIYSNIEVAIRNYHDNQQVQAQQNLVNQLTLQTQKTSLLIAYYNSPSYQDMAARSRLGMKLPGETVYAVKGLPAGSSQSDSLNSSIFEPSTTESASSTTQTNFMKWVNYFDGKGR